MKKSKLDYQNYNDNEKLIPVFDFCFEYTSWLKLLTALFILTSYFLEPGSTIMKVAI